MIKWKQFYLELYLKKNIEKTIELEVDLVKIKYADNPNNLQSALKVLNKNHVVNKNLHEIK